MSNAGTRVIKVGGSLLEMPDLADRLRTWLARQRPARNLFIAGGGRFVDKLRALDQLHRLGEEACHWLAIDAMSLTAKVLHTLVREWPIVASWRDLAEATRGAAQPVTLVLDPRDVLRADEAADDALPHSWEVTSDSIAARVATLIHRCRQGEEVELVLLKSSLPQEDCDRAQAAAAGYVDAHFPHAARGLNVACVDLRDSEYPRRSL